MKLKIGLVLFLSIWTTSIAQSASPVTSAKSPAVLEAIARHDTAIKKAEDDHSKAVVDANATYVDALNAALLKATDAKDTNEVIAIRQLLQSNSPGGASDSDKPAFAMEVKSAKKVVYLCDASGSMGPVFDLLRKLVVRSANNLQPTQSFNVIFFSGESTWAFNNGLVPASDENKKKVTDWIAKITPHNQTLPIPAIQKAFGNNPDEIEVVTDGFDQGDNPDLICRTFTRLNPKSRVKVNCFLLSNGAEPELAKILERISKENGGVFSPVGDDAVK